MKFTFVELKMNPKMAVGFSRARVAIYSALVCFSWMIVPYPFPALADTVLMSDPTEQFNVFCDANGGGTGECNRLDNNELLACEFSSQDFIQCRSRQGYLANCLPFAQSQFACRKIADVRLNSRGQCEDSLESSNGCRQPLRQKFTDPLAPLQIPDARVDSPRPIPNQDLLKNQFPSAF